LISPISRLGMIPFGRSAIFHWFECYNLTVFCYRQTSWLSMSNSICKGLRIKKEVLADHHIARTFNHKPRISRHSRSNNYPEIIRIIRRATFKQFEFSRSPMVSNVNLRYSQ
jgi:hypothetical protein